MSTRKREKRISAKLIPLLLIVTIIIGLAAPAAATAGWLPPATNLPFNDVPGNAWFRDDVGWAYSNGITTGTSPTAFSPNANVTRGQFVTFLHRIAGTPAVSGSHGFRDVSAGEFFAASVLWASQTGVTTGTSPTTFDPHAPITREQLAVMLHRYIRITRTTHITAPDNAIDHFPDRGQVSTWAQSSVKWAAYYGIIGRDGSLNPNGNATRAEAVAMLHRTANDFLTDNRTPQHRPPPPPPVINPLTGLATDSVTSRNRPVMVSIANNRSAMPTNATNGISQADVVYELLVEYGVTRLMALYQDFSNVGLVGSIRSVRHYTVELAEAHDAILIHAGGSQHGLEEITSRNITNFNEVEGPRRSIFSRNILRIPDHTMELYQSCVTTGPAAISGFSRYRIRTTQRNDFVNPYLFTHNPIPTGGARAHEVTVRFSREKSTSFTFNENNNLYTMSQYTGVFRDANNDAAVTFTNLIIIRIPISALIDHRGDPSRRDMSTVGSGTGYFVSNGRMIAINWSRPDKSSQFVFTQGNGSIIELGRGKTYIGIIPTDGTNAGVTFR